MLTGALGCLEDCLYAASHAQNANDYRFDERFCDEEVYADQAFTSEVASAERALRRAQEQLGELEGPSHSRLVRICTQGCKSCEQLIEMLNRREDAVAVEMKAGKVIRLCERNLRPAE